MSNEFKGKTLEGAVARATASYRSGGAGVERKFSDSCTDLALEISDLKREVGRIGDEVSDLENDAEALRRDAFFELGFAALNALSNLAGAARGASAIAKLIAARSVRALTREDVFDLLGAFGPLATIGAAIKGVVDLIEADRLADKADRIANNGQRLGDDLLDAVDAYDRAGCGSGAHLQS